MLQWNEAKGARRTMIAWLAMGLLMLAAAGCTRPDWIEQTLVTVDVTGVWKGTYGIEPFEVTLQQSGPNVTGQFMMRTGGQGRVDGPVEGTINGDILRFHDSRGRVAVEAQVNGDEMTGSGSGAFSVGGGGVKITLRRQS